MVTEKLDRIWSERRERNIAVRIQYSWEERHGCKVYSLEEVEELD